jgi:hypothetical protein
MSPQKSMRHFLPMLHKPLKSISNYALATDKIGAEHMVVVKPQGLDVYIADGRIYDFQQREITNNVVLFELAKVLEASVNTKSACLGVLSSEDLYFYKKLPRLYDSKPVSFKNLLFTVYDMIFPFFDFEADYFHRYDVASKVIGKLTNCEPATIKVVKNSFELTQIASELMTEDITRTLIVYNTKGKYIYGNSQLLYQNPADIVSYSISADQRYRAHIKKVHSTTEILPDGIKYETAAYITAKYKHEFIDIELPDNKVLCKSIWDYRSVLKPIPFWFTGYTALDKQDYKLLINKFHSFIL